jgi:Outer membrane protein beta-barrel domain
MKKFLILILFTGLAYQSWAQSTSPAQTLRLATSTYEQGRLHELEGILGNLENFTTEQKVAAYKLLTQAYIYLEEPQKADETMLKLLDTDHYFQINPEIDPAEFVALYRTFRTEPVYALGLKFGPSLVIPSVITDYYTASESPGTGEYSPGIAFQAGLFFEKKIFKRIILSPEVMLASRRFSEEYLLFSSDSIPTNIGGKTESIYKQTWLDINLIAQYEISRNASNTFITYAGIGPGVSLSLSQKNQITTTGLSNSTVSGADIDVKDSFRTAFYSVAVTGGFKYRIGAIYVHAELRYQQGFTNIVNEDTRTNLEATLDYSSQINDFTLGTLTGAIGVSYPFFKPIKIRK